MAVTQQTFTIVLNAKDGTSTVFKAAGDGAKEAAKGFESLEGKLVSVHAAIGLAKEAFGEIKDKIDELTDAYRRHEDSNKLFLRAMEYSGNYSTKSAQQLTAYAASLQKIAGIDKTTTLGLMAQAKAIGLTDAQTQKAISASANLAAARGMDIGSAFEKVLGTIHGSTGGLEDMVPALRHVNVEALAAGAGFDLIEKQFKGAAAEGGATWEGYSARATAAKEDIIAAIGEVVTKGLDLTAMAKRSAELWEGMAEHAERFKGTAIAALQAIRAGFAGIDWQAIAGEMKYMAAILAVAFGPALLATLGTAALAVAGFAATWVAVPIGIAASVLAIDLVVKNMAQLPALATLFGDIFERSLLNVRQLFDGLLLAITQGIASLLEKIPGGSKLFGGAIEGLSSFSRQLDSAIDADSKKFDDLGKAIGGVWGKLDQGLAGKLIEQLKAMGANVEAVFARVKAAQAGAKDAHGNKGEGQRVAVEDPRLKEQMAMAERQFKGFIEQGRAAEIEASKIGLTEAQAVQAEFETLKKNADAAYALIVQFHGKSTIEAQKYAAALAQLEQAKAAKIAQINKEALIAGSALLHKAFDSDVMAIQTQLADQTRALDEAARRDTEHWQDYQDAKVLIQDKAFDEMLDKASTVQKLGMTANAARNVDVGATAKGVGQGASQMLAGNFTDGAKTIEVATRNMAMVGKAVLSLASDMYDATVGQFVQASQYLVENVLSGKWVKQLADTINDMGNIPNEMLNAFQNLGVILDRLVQNLPSMIQNLLNQLPGLMQKIMAELPVVIKEIAAMLPQIAQAFAKAVPGMVSAILDALPALIDGLVAAIEDLMDKIPDILTNILKALPTIIQHLIAGIADIIVKMIQQLPALVEDIADNIGPIVEALVQGIMDAIPQIIDALCNVSLWLKVAAAIVKAIINVIVGLVQGIFRGLADTISGHEFKIKVPDSITNIGANISNGMATALDTIRKSSGDLFKVSDFKSAAKSLNVSDQIRAAADSSANEIAQQFTSLWQRFAQAVKDAFMWVWNTIFAPINALIATAWQWVVDHVVSPLVHVGQEVWQWVSDHVVQPLLHVGQEVWQWVYDHIVGPLSTIGSSAFQWVVDHVVTPMQSAFKGIANFKFPAFAWPDIKVPDLTIQKPSWWNLSSGGPVGGISGRVTGAIANSSVGQVASGAYHKVLGHAAGGLIKNGLLYAASGTAVMGTDTVPAMLTPGEYVINRQSVGKVGLPALNSINAGQMPGGGISVSAPINITTTAPIDDNFVRNKLVPTMMDAIKKASQDGKYVISQKGIRSA